MLPYTLVLQTEKVWKVYLHVPATMGTWCTIGDEVKIGLPSSSSLVFSSEVKKIGS